MSEDRIDSIIDVAKVKQELAETSQGVKDLVALLQSVKGKSLDIMGSTNVSEVNKLQKELANLKQQAGQSAAAIVDVNKALKAQTQSLDENIKKQTEYKNRIQEINAELKKLEAAQKIVNSSTAPGNEDEKRDIQEKIDLLNKELAVKKILDKEISKTIVNQVKETEGLNDNTKAREKEAKAAEKQAAASEKAAKKAAEEARPYKQLALAFAAAAKEAQDLAAKYGTMDKRSQAAAKRANELNNELKKIDASIGNHQRNVGNYASAFDKVGTSVRNLGTSFLALLGITGLGSLFSSSIDEFIEMDKNVRQLQNTLKNLGVPEAFDRISASADKLQKRFTYLDNDEILKTFNQLIVYGKLTEKQINELIPVIIDFSAASGQDLASATSTIIKSIEGNGKALKEYGINMKDAKSVTEGFSLIMTQLKPKVDGVAQSFQDSASGGLASAKQEFKDLKEEIGAGVIPILNSVISFLLDAAKGAKVLYNNLKDLFTLKAPGTTNALNANIIAGQQLTEKFLKTIENSKPEEKLTKVKEELGSINQQLKLAQDYQRVKVDDKGQTYIGMISDKERNEDLAFLGERKRLIEDQIKLLQTPVDPNKVLGLGGDTDAAKEAAKKAAEDAKRAREEAAKKAEELAERIRKANFEAAKSAQEELIKLQEDIFKDETKSFDERIAALQQFVQEKARLIELERTFEKGAKGLTKEEIVAIETEKQTELNQLLRDGHKEYNDILAKEQKKEQDLHKENADRIKKIHKDLQDAIQKGLDEANARLKATLDEREALEKEKAQLREELVNESIGLAFDLITAQYEREKNLIQEQIDLLEKKKQKDIEVANATITNAQDRAAAITTIEARAAAEQAVLEQKQRQVNIKQAQFEKAESIANIIAKTAEAIIATLAKTPPPAGIPLALLIGAIGAAQLARVIATPVPRYKEGTMGHTGGLMIVGDGGKSEGIELPDGTVIRSPATSTLMDAPKGTKVYSDYSKMMLKATVTSVPVYKEVTRSDKTDIAVAKMEKSVVTAIKKIPQQHITVENIIRNKIRRGNNTTTYLS